MTHEFDQAREEVLTIIQANPDIEFQTVARAVNYREELLAAVFTNLSRSGIIIKTNSTPKRWRTLT